MPIFRLRRELVFPRPELAEPEGLLAVGGDLSVERLLLAYRSGIFPWYGEGQPILWWSPDPRMVLFPDKLRVSESLRRIVKSGKFDVTFDRDFVAVIRQCRTVARPGQEDTWITPAMERAYIHLHQSGHAHSVEVRRNDDLVGGLYGVSVGHCFCGESMFAHVSNTSKVAVVALVGWLRQNGGRMIDCQVPTPHLKSLGAEEVPRARFLELLREASDEGETIWPGEGEIFTADDLGSGTGRQTGG